MRRLLDECRLWADVVLMDTAPILVASEVAPVVADVDVVLLVAEAGRTSTELAERSSELLLRLGAPVVGVALNKATEMTVPRGYNRYYYTARAQANAQAPHPNAEREVVENDA
jgi:Mrp family chromosome partitioning ATPase